MDVATQIRMMRAMRGLTQQELAARSGIPNTYISLIESGKLLPSGDWLEQLKTALSWPEQADEAFLLLAAQEQMA